jgi:DNA-binding MarR family transcriptional regulator
LAVRRFLAFSEGGASESGVTNPQYQAMLAIKTPPGGMAQVKDFTDQMLIRHNGAVQLADRLVAADLVERRSAPDDQRGVLLALTEKGERTQATLAAAHLPKLRKHESLLADLLKQLRRIPTGATR